MVYRIEHDEFSGFALALKAFGKSQAAFAAEVGITPQSLGKWHRNGVPPSRVKQVEEMTGISRHVLRPDLYPIPAGATIRVEGQPPSIAMPDTAAA